MLFISVERIYATLNDIDTALPPLRANIKQQCCCLTNVRLAYVVYKRRKNLCKAIRFKYDKLGTRSIFGQPKLKHRCN